ncbi:ABC transporter substrate-binding protein [Leucobacter insecticola]|uniref:ABC transporter substrate-binding protein n=1 Tax=Leucobacter insecticola TaxID=2714934 RepID=A0A6G8FGK1_9MICO|nr:ABC transporter substrate-binding protein [Leucobacter insecticola]QIM15590.1 ABC transporter substrate-binding protein [Leucobacter insecticola]
MTRFLSPKSAVRGVTSVALVLGAALLLSACSGGGPANDEKSADATTVTITDNHGKVEVPVNPKTVVALDNTSFDTLSAWDVDLAAVPKGVMGSVWPEYTDDEKVIDVGNHREPNLEAIVAAQPDLIIGGYRFGDYYDEIKKQNPQAVVIEIAPREGEDVFAELERQTEILGQIFDREDDAKALNDKLEAAMADAKTAYNGTDTVMAVNTSAGKIGYIAPETGRALGPVFPALGWVPALEVEGGTSNHKGDDISVEAIADSNPDWIVALDRDAAFAVEDREAGSAPATELISNAEALKNVTAVKDGHIVILDANFYLTEGIQAYTELFKQLGTAFSAK